MSPRRLVTATLGLVLVLAACSSPSPSPSATASGTGPAPSGALRPVRLLLGFRPDVQFAPFYLAQQAGYFADAGLEVTIEHSDDVLLLVADGQAEFGVADATDVMIARTVGIPIRMITKPQLYNHFPVALIGAPDHVPSTPAALAGMSIGTPGRFGSSWHALLALLEAGGLTPSDVEIREYPAFNQVEGLLNGDVDLITGFRVNEPIQLEAQGFETALMTVDEIIPLPGPGIVAGDEVLASDPEIVASIQWAVFQAQEVIAGDLDAGVDAAIAEVPAIGEDRETAAAVLQATVQLWLDERGKVAVSYNREAWESGYETMRVLGFIDGSVPLSEMATDFSVEQD